jgi:hypothetical protein
MISIELGNKSGIKGMFYIYHNKYLLMGNADGISVNYVVEILFRIVVICSYYFSFIFINNTIRSKRVLTNLRFLLVPLLYLITDLAASRRTGVIYLVFASMFFYYILIKQNNNWKSNDAFIVRIFFICCLLFFVISIVHYISGIFMERTQNTSVFDYLSGYLGGGIPNLNYYLEQNNIALIGDFYPNKEAMIFRTYSNVRCNLYTILSGINYGFFAFICYLSILSMVFNYYYYSYVYKKVRTDNQIKYIIIYGFAAQGLLFAGLTDIIYKNIFSIGFGLFVFGTIFLDNIIRNRKFRRHKLLLQINV